MSDEWYICLYCPILSENSILKTIILLCLPQIPLQQKSPCSLHQPLVRKSVRWERRIRGHTPNCPAPQNCAAKWRVWSQNSRSHLSLDLHFSHVNFFSGCRKMQLLRSCKSKPRCSRFQISDYDCIVYFWIPKILRKFATLATKGENYCITLFSLWIQTFSSFSCCFVRMLLWISNSPLLLIFMPTS